MKSRCQLPVTNRRNRRLTTTREATRRNPKCRPSADPVGAPSDEKPARALAGATIGDLDIFTRRELNVPHHVQGVVVHQVQPDSPAERAGLRACDIITEINCSPVVNALHAVMIAGQRQDDRILLQVWGEKALRHCVIYKSSPATDAGERGTA